MNLEIGQRVIFRSLHWEVADNASESYVELFGRSRENRGRSVRVILGLEPIERAEAPNVEWAMGEPNWDHTAWKALHDAYRLTLSHGRGHLGSVDWGRLILEPYQLVPLRRIENLPFPRLMLADDTGLGKTAEAGLILAVAEEPRPEVPPERRPEAPPEPVEGLVEGPIEGDREGAQRVEFLSPGHPLVRAALRRMRGRVFSPGFHQPAFVYPLAVEEQTNVLTRLRHNQVVYILYLFTNVIAWHRFWHEIGV